MARAELNLKVLAQGLDELRESIRATVAALKDEGFTDEQARTIVTGIFAQATLNARKENSDG